MINNSDYVRGRLKITDGWQRNVDSRKMELLTLMKTHEQAVGHAYLQQSTGEHRIEGRSLLEQ